MASESLIVTEIKCADCGATLYSQFARSFSFDIKLSRIYPASNKAPNLPPVSLVSRDPCAPLLGELGVLYTAVEILRTGCSHPYKQLQSIDSANFLAY